MLVAYFKVSINMIRFFENLVSMLFRKIPDEQMTQGFLLGIRPKWRVKEV